MALLIVCFSAIPTLTLLNIAIIRKLRDATRWRKGTTTKTKTPASSRATINMTKMLIAVSCTTTVMLIPNSIVTVLQFSNTLEELSTTLERRANIALIITTVRMFFYLNSTIHFFLYCVTGEKFRRVFFHMLMSMCCCCSRTPRMTSLQEMSSLSAKVDKTGNVLEDSEQLG